MDGYSENVIKKIMPHDDDAERAVLTSMLMSGKAISEAQEIIKIGDEFYNRVYGVIYDTIVEMENSGLKVDPVTLKDKLGEKELPPEVASLSYLMEIMKDSPLEIVEVYCPLEICRQRNIERGDRFESQSQEQAELMNKEIKYRMRVDTSRFSAEECAEQIIRNLF